MNLNGLNLCPKCAIVTPFPMCNCSTCKKTMCLRCLTTHAREHMAEAGVNNAIKNDTVLAKELPNG